MKTTPEARAALQSARAKNRKLAVALGEAGLLGVKIPASVIKAVKDTAKYLDGRLAPKVKKVPTTVERLNAVNTDGGAASTDEAENSGADLEAVADGADAVDAAWAARLQELVAA